MLTGSIHAVDLILFETALENVNVKLLAAEQNPAASGSRITETRLDNGDSDIRVVVHEKEVANYRINLSGHHHPATDPNDPVIKAWEKWEFGAFLCFNSNQFDGREIDRSTDPKIYDPPAVDVKQWISTFKAAGMDNAVLTVRHTSGFLLWDSPTSKHDVAQSGNQADVVKLYVEQCRRQGLQPGIYYCLWGGKFNPAPNARAVILAQLHELATQYGPIPYFWIDMGNWKPDDLSIQEIYDSLKNVNPKTVVMFNQHIQDGRQLKYFPTDVLNGEMCLPPAGGHNPRRQVDGKSYYLPLEYEPCSQKRGGHKKLGGWDYSQASWFTYGAGRNFEPSEPFPATFLYQWIQKARDRGAANVLLACAPDHTGRIRDEDVRQLTELGRMLKTPSLAPQEPPTEGVEAAASTKAQ